MTKRRRRASRPRPATDREGTGPRDHWRSDGKPKARFTTQADANRWSLQMRLEEGADLHPYLCSFCDGWHLGTVRS